jgi:hypothetical protein
VIRHGVWAGNRIYWTLYNLKLQYTVHYNTDYFTVFTSVAWQRLPTAAVPLLPDSRPRRKGTISSNCNSRLTPNYSWQSAVTQFDSPKAQIRSRYIASGRTAQKTPLPTALLLLRVQLLLRSRDGYRQFPSNGRLCWFHNSGLQQTCHNNSTFWH